MIRRCLGQQPVGIQRVERREQHPASEIARRTEQQGEWKPYRPSPPYMRPHAQSKRKLRWRLRLRGRRPFVDSRLCIRRRIADELCAAPNFRQRPPAPKIRIPRIRAELSPSIRAASTAGPLIAALRSASRPAAVATTPPAAADAATAPVAPSRSATSSSSRAARRSQQELPGRVAAYPGLRRAAAGLRRDPAPAVPRRLDRPPGPDALPDRSQHLCGAAGAGRGQSAERPRQRRRRPDRAPAATRRSPRCRRSPSRIIPTPSPRRGRPTPPVAQNSADAARRADQHALHPRAGADHRPDRPVERHRRRAGHRQPDRCAGDDHAARPGLSSTSSNRRPTS